MHGWTPNNVIVVTLWAENVTATAHFYRDVLGLPNMAHSASGKLHFQLDNLILVILPGTVEPPGEPRPGAIRFPRLAFAVPDIEAAVANLQAHRVALPWGIEVDAMARWVMFYDPAGNLIELAELSH